MRLFEKKPKTFLTGKEEKPVLKVHSTVVPQSFDDKIRWDRHMYDNITVYRDK